MQEHYRKSLRNVSTFKLMFYNLYLDKTDGRNMSMLPVNICAWMPRGAMFTRCGTTRVGDIPLVDEKAGKDFLWTDDFRTKVNKWIQHCALVKQQCHKRFRGNLSRNYQANHSPSFSILLGAAKSLISASNEVLSSQGWFYFNLLGKRSDMRIF